jgi:type I restriction enzyme S subunit
MTAKQLKNSILQMAVQGKLVPQDPNDEPASFLLKRIKAEKERLIKEKRIKASKPLPPITDDEIPFDLPEGWEWVRLGNITEIKGGKRVSNGYKLLTTPTPHIYIRVSDMKNGSIDDSDLHYIDENMYQKIKQYIITKDDLYMTIVGATIGKCGYVPEMFDMMNLTENAARIILFGSNKYFLLSILESYFCQEQFVDKTNQVGVQKMALNRLSTTLIPLPPLSEQHRIVARIEELLPLIEEYGEKYDKLENYNKSFLVQMKKSILQAAVQGKLVEQDSSDEPASVLLERIRAEKERLVKSGKIKKSKPLPPIQEDEIPFDVPSGWEWCRLSDIVYNHGQMTPQEDFCYIDIGSIDNKKQKLNENETIISAAKAPSRSRKIVKFGDILYSTVRPYLHNMCIVDKEFSKTPIASTGFAVFTCLKGVYNRYLFLYLLSPDFDSYANDNENSKGIAYPAINDTRLYNAVVPIPPLAEQEQIVARLEELLGVVEGARESIG